MTLKNLFWPQFSHPQNEGITLSDFEAAVYTALLCDLGNDALEINVAFHLE